jgi:hypothetical protein
MKSPSAVLSPKRQRVRFPRHRSLKSVFAYLKRAYPVEPQPVKGINDVLTFLEDLGFWFVWTGDEWGLQCRGCGMDYVRIGHAGNHKCSPGPLGAASSDRAKRPEQPLEGSAVPETMSWDLRDAGTTFEHAKDAVDGQFPSGSAPSADEGDF